MNLMETKKRKKLKIELKKINRRGDEVGFLFLEIVIFAFLIFGLFRFLPIGKLIDDFLFSLLFGWTKYLVYIVLLVFSIPIFCNRYFKLNFLTIFTFLLACFLISWTVQNIFIAVIHKNYWFNSSNLRINLLTNYFNKWWSNSIINNYHGFFTHPIAFESFTWAEIFKFEAVGGILSNFLIAIFSYGFFIVNFIVNLLFIVLLICVMLGIKIKSWFYFLNKKIISKKEDNDLPYNWNQEKINIDFINKKNKTSDSVESKAGDNFSNIVSVITTEKNKSENKNEDFCLINHEETIVSTIAIHKKDQPNQQIKIEDNLLEGNNNQEKQDNVEQSVLNSSEDNLIATVKNEILEPENYENADITNNNYQLPFLESSTDFTDINYLIKQNQDYALANKNKINQLFQEFNIEGVVNSYHIGTTVTKYEIAIVSGMRVSKVTSLEDELKLALANNNIRIEAPIPGKSMIGIEVSNPQIVPITLAEQMKHIPTNEKNSDLLISIGKTTTGEYLFHSLKNMPHLLIAGSTGSGKSVFINNLLVSLLLYHEPKKLKLLLIDPKWVELVIYNGIPHLLRPVINEAKTVPDELQKVIEEMMRRYQLLASTSSRNIDSYNSKIINENDKLPYYVIIIDELADLMLENNKAMEEKIMRLTQMGRAAGIHLVVATQRPSTDIITGVIKNNIISRIAFKVASWIDSKTIIDTAGAEKLVGRGDMLFQAPGFTGLQRIQAPWINEGDVIKLIDFIKEQNT